MQFQTPNTRRSFLKRSGMGFGSIALNSLLSKDSLAAQQAETHFPGKAKHVIHVFLNGGMSQVDTFDPKPELTKRGGQMLPFDNLQTERRTGVALPSPFEFKQHGVSGIPVSDLFPHLSKCVDDMAVIRSMYAELPSHELSLMLMNTGTQRLVRNLGPSEIVGQIMLARDHLGEWPTAERPSIYERELSNIVMMGMGEPLYNFDNVSAALKIVMDDAGIAISRRRITLSTAGVVPLIERCGAELGVNLAVSLHAVRDELRDEIVPINRKYPIAELLAACHDYPGVRNSRRITFEYVMLRDVNDSDADARELVRLIAGIPSKVNLIPFNPWPGAPYDRSTDERIEAFAEIVRAAGYPSPVRTPRGEDIMAACGQLKSESERPRRSAAE